MGNFAATLCQRQRCVLMMEQLGQTAVCLQHTLSDRCPVNGYPDRQCIDKKTKDLVSTDLTLHTSEQDRAKNYVFQPRGPSQNLCPGNVEQAGNAHAQQSRLLAQPTAKVM